jgi:hypothetical protein
MSVTETDSQKNLRTALEQNSPHARPFFVCFGRKVPGNTTDLVAHVELSSWEWAGRARRDQHRGIAVSHGCHRILRSPGSSHQTRLCEAPAKLLTRSL